MTRRAPSFEWSHQGTIIAAMARRRVGMPNLSALTNLTRRAGSFERVPAPVGGVRNRRAVMAGGGPAAQQAVKAALTKLGTYVWGAKGPNNFDCSGLTLWAYCQAGITLGCPTPTPRSRTANRLRRVTSRPVV
jgi:cell wall-associated NlpC family hydrolase